MVFCGPGFLYFSRLHTVSFEPSMVNELFSLARDENDAWRRTECPWLAFVPEAYKSIANTLIRRTVEFLNTHHPVPSAEDLSHACMRLNAEIAKAFTEGELKYECPRPPPR